MREPRYRISPDEIKEYRLLTLKESVLALKHMGINDMSESIIRNCSTNRLIPLAEPGPKLGSISRGVIGYYSKEVILALADIRLQQIAEHCGSFNDLVTERMPFRNDQDHLKEIERQLLDIGLDILPLLKNHIRMSGSTEHLEMLSHYIRLIDQYGERKKAVDGRSFGKNLPVEYSNKLDEFLDERF